MNDEIHPIRVMVVLDIGDGHNRPVIWSCDHPVEIVFVTRKDDVSGVNEASDLRYVSTARINYVEDGEFENALLSLVESSAA